MAGWLSGLFGGSVGGGVIGRESVAGWGLVGGCVDLKGCWVLRTGLQKFKIGQWGTRTPYQFWKPEAHLQLSLKDAASSEDPHIVERVTGRLQISC